MIGAGDAVKLDKGDKSSFAICCLFPAFTVHKDLGSGNETGNYFI